MEKELPPERSLDPHGRYFSAQKQNGSSGDCGLHCIRNLLENNDVQASDLHDAAKNIARITGDSFDNHEHEGAWWSSDSIIYELSRRGYNVDYEHGEDFNFDDSDIIGYIIHDPLKNHYKTVRRSTLKQGFVEVVDSLEGIESMRQRRLALNAKNGSWNVISVKQHIKEDNSKEVLDEVVF